MIFFTSITANYIPKARILARSVKEHQPGATFVLMLSDEIPASIDLGNEPFDAIWRVEDLDLPVPSVPAWVFSHSVVELCTAVKGQTFLKLFEKFGADKVVFLDPDIIVLDSLAPLEKLLDSHSVLLTPHLVEPEATLDGILDNEICTLRHGIYNLGFLAVRNSVEGKRFLTWWRDRLIDFCYDDIPRGIFTDQRWVDLAPALFPDIKIVRDKVYNVATWNLSHRLVHANADGKLFIGEDPIRFYHFSGFDSGAQEAMLNKYAPGNQALLDFRNDYIARMEKEGQASYGKMPCVYGAYDNGEVITKQQRVLYRDRLDLQRAFPNPFLTTPAPGTYLHWFNTEGRRELSGPTPVRRFKNTVKAKLPRLFAAMKATKNLAWGRALRTEG